MFTFHGGPNNLMEIRYHDAQGYFTFITWTAGRRRHYRFDRYIDHRSVSFFRQHRFSQWFFVHGPNWYTKFIMWLPYWVKKRIFR